MRMSIKAEKIYIFFTNTLIINLLNSLRKLYQSCTYIGQRLKFLTGCIWGTIYIKTISMTYYLKNLGSASSQGSKVHYGELPRQASAVIYLCLTAT